MNQPLLIGLPRPPKPIVHARSCGKCFYGEPHPGSKELVVCKGAPPTAILLAMQQDALGRPNPIIESFWPVVRADAKACALFADNGPEIYGKAQ